MWTSDSSRGVAAKKSPGDGLNWTSEPEKDRLGVDNKELSHISISPKTDFMRSFSNAQEYWWSVSWIEKGKQTTRVAEAEQSFSDLEQAKAQVLYFEKKGSAAEKKLALLAFRQWRGRRFRQKKGFTKRSVGCQSAHRSCFSRYYLTSGSKSQ